jgi:hypothetical protein
MRSVLNESCREDQSTDFIFSNIFSENCAVYEIMWKKCGRVILATDDNILQCMQFACWITKAADTHSEYVILISFPWQWWLQKHA